MMWAAATKTDEQNMATPEMRRHPRNRFVFAIFPLLAIVHLVIVNQNDFGAKFYAFVGEKPVDEAHSKSSLNLTLIDDTADDEENEYLLACLFLDDDSKSSSSATDLAEWLAYHYHVLPLRYLIVANNQTSPIKSRSVREIMDKYRSHFPSLTILEWIDEDYMTRPIVHRHVKTHIVTLQERKRIFYYRCVQAVQHHHRHDAAVTSNSAWTWLAHNFHEYLVVNPQVLAQLLTTQTKRIPTLYEPGSLLRSIQLWSREQSKEAAVRQTSPACLGMETWDAVSLSDRDNGNTYKKLPPSLSALNTSSLRTWTFQQARRRRSAGHVQTSNGARVVDHARLLDMMRIPTGDIIPQRRSLYPIILSTNNGTDCRTVNFVGVLQEARNELKGLGRKISSENLVQLDVRPWTAGFVQSVGEETAMDLLGQLRKRDNLGTPSQELEERCAMLFFGLPRAYDTMVLPSITKNVLIPNARHNCDVYVHYYYMTMEPAGRKNKGGSIDPTAILKLADAVRMVARNYPTTSAYGNYKAQGRVPHVAFTHDTDEAFWHFRNRSVQKYRTVKDKDEQYLYFPWKASSYVYPSSLDNIVKQWHSIESVWNLMERAIRQGVANYTRVALLRNDVMFVTPFDIYRTSYDDEEDDVEGRYAIIPPFGLYPVNDRLVYGSYHAVQIWATKRFELIEDHARNMPGGPGHGMHSEVFLQRSILVAMKRKAGVNVTMNPDICFFRTRADNTAMISDCDVRGKTRGIEKIDKEKVVMEMSGFTNCTRYRMGHQFEAMTCAS